VLVTAGGQQALHLTVELLVEPGTTSPSKSRAIPSSSRCCAAAARGSCSSPWTTTAWSWMNGSRLRRRLRLAGPPAADRRRALARAARGPHVDGGRARLHRRRGRFRERGGRPRGDAAGAARRRAGQRVAYVATLLQSLSPALRLGVLVASPSLIRAARALRRITTRHPPLSVQRIAAHLLALGHYDTIMARIGAAFRQRLLALRDALNHYLVHLIDIPPVLSGTCLLGHRARAARLCASSRPRPRRAAS
jgi:hypothetical protein